MNASVLRALRGGVVLGLGVALASACGSRETQPEETSSSSAALEGDDAGDATSADGASDAADGATCRNVVLVASKTYGPSAWADATQTLAPSMRFALPAEVPVTSGNSGNHWITFTFSLSGTAFTCRYNGGASQAHPNSPAQIALGLKYKLGTCTNGAVAGTVLEADFVKLHVDNGDSYKNPTTVRMSLDEAAPCATTCNPSTCNDQNACNGVESCDSNGECQPGVLPAVDDGNVCTVDSCSAQTGVSHVPSPNGTGCGPAPDACSGALFCDGSGVCVQGAPPAIDDGNACTADTCSPITGVSHTPIAVDDNDACTVDSCNALTGVSHTPVAIDDSDACTVDSCSALTGVAHAPVAFDDGNACTADACNPITGVSHVPEQLGLLCGVASDACSGAFACDGASTCVQGPPPVVDDGNACTADACNPITGVSHAPVAAGTSCGDNSNLCVGTFACDANASCLQGPAPVVDDGNVCTTDTCVSQTGVAHAPVAVGTGCGDNSNQCAGAFTCGANAQCSQGPAPTVNDGNICTIDTCSPGSGVSHMPISGCDPSPTEGSEVFEKRASLLGRVVDKNGNGVAGATFQVHDLPADTPRNDVGVTTAGDGSFRLRLSTFADHEIAGVGAQHVSLWIDSPSTIRAYRDAWLRPGDAPNLGDIVVVARDPKITVIGAAGGTATDSQGLVEVVVPPGALAQNVPVQITPFLTRAETPAVLPDSTLTTYAFELEPSGTQLAIPATVRAKNYRNVPNTIAMPVGVYDAVHGAWQHETSGTLNGQFWQFSATHFSTYDLNGAQNYGNLVVTVTDGTDGSNGNGPCGGSTLGASNGALRQTLSLPGTAVRGRPFGLTFNYDSGFAGSRQFNYGPTTTRNLSAVPLTSFTVAVPGTHATAECVASGGGAGGGGGNSCVAGKCVLSGTLAPLSFGHDLGGTHATNDQTVDANQTGAESGTFLTVPLDDQAQPIGTGFVTRSMTVQLGGSGACAAGAGSLVTFGTGDVGSNRVNVNLEPGPLAQYEEKTLIHHRHSSPFGAGWGISEISQLFVAGPDHVVLVNGDGQEEDFRPRAERTTGFQYPNTSSKPVFGRDPVTNELFAMSFVGGQLAKVNADLTITQLFSGLATGRPHDLAIAYVNNQRVFVVAADTGLLTIDGGGQMTTLAPRTVPSGQNMFNQAHVATRGDLVYYVSGETSARVLYKLRLSDPTPALAPLTVTTNGDQRLDPTFPLAQQQLTQPTGLAIGSDGSLYLADRGRNAVYRILPDAQGEIGATSLMRRAIGRQGGNFVLPRGDRLPGQRLPLSSPVYVTAGADGTILVATASGLVQYDPPTGDAQWLALNRNYGTAPDLGESWTDLNGVGNLVAVGPRSFVFSYASFIVRVDVPRPLASRYVPTRTLELANGQYFLVDGLAGTTEVFDVAGRQLESRMRTGEPVFSVQYVDSTSARIHAVTDAMGGQWTFTYGSGKLSTISDPSGRATTFGVDSLGDLTTLTTATGPDQETHTFAYAGHKMTTKTSPGGQSTTYLYSPNGNIAQATKPTGEVTMMTAALDAPPQKDASGSPIRVGTYTDPHGVTHTVTTNRTGNVDKDVWTADAVSYTRFTVYDPVLYEGTKDAKSNTIFRPSYHTLNGVQEERYLRWDTRGRLFRIGFTSNPTSDFIFLTYDASDRLVKTDGPGNLDITHYEYETAAPDARLSRVWRAKDDVGQSTVTAQETKWSYLGSDPYLPSAVKSHGVTYDYTRDPKGNIASVKDGLLLGTTLYTRDAKGNVTSVEARDAANALVTSSTFDFDGQDRLTASRDALSNQTDYGYKFQGCGCTEGDKLTSVHTPDLPQNLAWTLGYHPTTGQLETLTDPDAHVTALTYDPTTGQLSQVVDANAHSATMLHDQLGRIAQITDSLGRTFGRAYPKPTAGTWTGPSVLTGGVATPTALTATLGDGQYQIGLDRFQTTGYPAQVSFYRDATFELSYGARFDAAKRLTYRRDRAGTGVTAGDAVPVGQGQYDDQVASYDTRTSAPLTTLTGTLSVGRSTTTYDDELDATGSTGEQQPLPKVTETYTRDGAGRLTAVSRLYSGTTGSGGSDLSGIPSLGVTPFPRNDTSFTYDSSGRLSQWKDADGTHDVFYDGRGQIAKITASSDGDYLFEYDAIGRNTKLTYPGGLERTEGYDHQGRITSRCYAHPNATTRCYGAIYDPTGNPTALSDPEGQDVVTYDALDRLSTVTRGVDTQTYDYNALGALKTNGDVVLDDQRPKLAGGGNASAAVPATYNNLPVTLDAGGRVTSLQGETLLYSRRGALAGIRKVNGATTDAEYYGHDASGRRIATVKASTTGGVTTFSEEFYEWTGANVTGQLDVAVAGGTPTVVVGKTWLFEGVDRPLRLRVGGLKYFYEVDLAGNVRRLRRPDGSDAGGYRYSAFGKLSATDATVDQPLRWKARWWSEFGGIYDVRARQWSPALGAFTSIDEFAFHDANATLWAWPNQNPTRYADPSGRCPWCVPLLEGIGTMLLFGAAVPSNTAQMPADLPGMMMAVPGVGPLVGAALKGIIGPLARYFAGEAFTAQLARGAVREAAQLSCPVRGGVVPVMKGQAGVARAIAEIEASGGKVIGREITLEINGVRTRPDLLVRTKEGDMMFVEVKNGAGAGLTANQIAGFPGIGAGGAVPRGANAAAAGLEVGTPLPPTPVNIVHY